MTATRQVLRGLRSAETVTTRDVTVRVTPPAVAVVSTHHYVKLGGAEMVVYRVSPPDAASGVQVGDRFYPGFPAAGVNPPRKDIDPALRVAFFGLLYDQDLEHADPRRGARRRGQRGVGRVRSQGAGGDVRAAHACRSTMRSSRAWCRPSCGHARS